MRVGFVGAGLMGRTMGMLLSRSGYEVVGYFSRSETSAYRVAKEVGSKFFSDMCKLAASCDVLFITTPDDVIEPIARSLGQMGCLRGGQVLVHMSGSHSSTILQPALIHGAEGLSMHPLQSCASPEEAMINLPRSLFSLEGGPEALRLGKAMVSRICAEFFVLNSQDKILYHGAACMASNYLVALFDGAQELLELSGVDPGLQVPALISLMEGTLSNLKALPPEEALTGPIARGDIGTVSRHLRAIEKTAPHLLDIYKTMGRQALQLARNKGRLDEEKLTILEALLKN
jgi:predicted short-subunit dehydrogenase-like oxidoreductase (DUF2520 family)